MWLGGIASRLARPAHRGLCFGARIWLKIPRTVAALNVSVADHPDLDGQCDRSSPHAKVQRSALWKCTRSKVAGAIELSGPTETVSLDPGEFLFREGDVGDALYIVRKGLLRIVSGSTVYETVTTGGIVGEMAIVEPGARRSAAVIAETRAELVRIDRSQFLALVADTPDFSLDVMQVMARRLRVMNLRYRYDHQQTSP